MKKFICLFASIMLLLTLASCSKDADNSSVSNEDPISLAKFLDNEGYSVKMIVDDEEIKEFANEFNVRAKGIYCLFIAAPDEYEYEKMGVFVYCESIEIAQTMAEDLQEFVDENEDFDEEVDRGIVERKDNLVFIGCEDAWEDAQ